MSFTPRAACLSLSLVLSLAIGCSKEEQKSDPVGKKEANQQQQPNQNQSERTEAPKSNAPETPQQKSEPEDIVLTESLEFLKLIEERDWSFRKRTRDDDLTKLVQWLQVVSREDPLNIDDCKILSGCKTVQDFHLFGKGITDEAMLEILKGAWPSLELIQVDSETVTDKGIAAIAKHDTLTRVEIRRGSHDTAKGIPSLASLPNLKSLHLFNMPLTDSGLEAFQNATSLRTLSLDWVIQLSNQTADQILNIPNLEILRLDLLPEAYQEFYEKVEDPFDAIGLMKLVRAFPKMVIKKEAKVVNQELLVTLVKDLEFWPPQLDAE